MNPSISTSLDRWLELSSVLLKQTVTDNPFIPQRPTAKQAFFLSLVDLEAFFGGAAGGAKSSALLMAALQFAHVPGYSALILRKTFADLYKPDALIPRSMAWLGGKAKWSSQKHQWTFPKGATLSFGYIDTEKDKFMYQGAAYQFIGFDETTQFRESDYRYLFSRLRKLEGVTVPIRMRAASNPGGFGHQWCKRRFIEEGRQNGRWFIPAKLSDNPHLDQVEYRKSLDQLDPITRKQLLEGDWNVRAGGLIFKPNWFEVIKAAPEAIRHWVRFWDLAATEAKEGTDPDWTAGALLGILDGVYYLRNVRRVRASPKGVEDTVRQCAMIDPVGTQIAIEQEPGASGKSSIDNYARRILVGYNFRGVPHHTDKVLRAGPLSSAAEAGNVKLVEGNWISDFLDEAEGFPQGEHDDQVDAVSGALNSMTVGTRVLLA